MKFVAVVQARMGSIRLPGKVMKPICGSPMIEVLLARLAMAKRIDQIVLATSTDEQNLPLIEHVEKLGYFCFKGSESDVLQRFLDAATEVKADVIVRITGDCPLVDPVLVDQAIDEFLSQSVDYYSNTLPATFPDGLDIEVFTLGALKRAAIESEDPFDREHVTPHFRKPGLFQTSVMRNDQDLSSLRWTVDEPADLDVISHIFQNFAPDIFFFMETSFRSSNDPTVTFCC